MPRTGRPRAFDENTVLAGARDLFWAQGYGATSVQDLVDGLSLQRGSLYGAFGDKRALYLKAVTLYATENRQRLESALDAAEEVFRFCGGFSPRRRHSRCRTAGRQHAGASSATPPRNSCPRLGSARPRQRRLRWLPRYRDAGAGPSSGSRRGHHRRYPACPGAVAPGALSGIGLLPASMLATAAGSSPESMRR